MRIKQIFSLCLLFVLSSAFLFCLIIGSESITLSSQAGTTTSVTQQNDEAVAKSSTGTSYSSIKRRSPGEPLVSDTATDSSTETSIPPATDSTANDTQSDIDTDSAEVTTDVVHPVPAADPVAEDPSTTPSSTADTGNSPQTDAGNPSATTSASTNEAGTKSDTDADKATDSSETAPSKSTSTQTTSVATEKETPSGITPEQLSLSSQISGPITEDKKLCLTLAQKVKSFTIKMEGETNRNLAIFEPQEQTYCANLLLDDFPDGSYKLTVEIKQDVQLKEVSVFNTLPVEVNRAESQVAEDQKMSELENKCSQAGAASSEECKVFYLAKYAERIVCQGLSSTACSDSIKAIYIGEIVESAKEYDSINAQKEGIFYKSMTVGKLESLVNQSNGEKILSLNIPLKEKETQIKIAQSYESITLDKVTGLTQAAPIVVMLDSDGDGVSDDIESRIGTKVNNKDTDGDGYKDGEELRNGYNPLGDGKKDMGLSPIERAIILDQALEHPTTSGVESANITFADAKTVYANNGTENGYTFNGKADANTVVTLYIYSDIPIVATVITDEYGNWEYHFIKTLESGNHEAYAVINDETGKVITKSAPLSFLVQEAKAAAPVETTNEQPAPEVADNSTNYYLYAAAGLALLGFIVLIVALLKSRNKNKKDKNEETPVEHHKENTPPIEKRD
ncbi:MAG: hypothetical protein PHX30_03735 [Candidatus Pacebacteria bacterium]|nr:hypothetical protein [Candidatus Paceibacterota bacterium]